MKCVAPDCAPSCFHHSASLYGVPPPIQNCADWPSIEGEPTNCVSEKPAALPFPPAPAHTVQFCHPVIWSMLLMSEPVAVVVLLLTRMFIGVLDTAPAWSHACTTT